MLLLLRKLTASGIYCTLRSRRFEGDRLRRGPCGEGDGAGDLVVVSSADESISILLLLFQSVNVQCMVLIVRMNIQNVVVCCICEVRKREEGRKQKQGMFKRESATSPHKF
jgi:hypothetical protein